MLCVQGWARSGCFLTIPFSGKPVRELPVGRPRLAVYTAFYPAEHSAPRPLWSMSFLQTDAALLKGGCSGLFVYFSLSGNGPPCLPALKQQGRGEEGKAPTNGSSKSGLELSWPEACRGWQLVPMWMIHASLETGARGCLPTSSTAGKASPPEDPWPVNSSPFLPLAPTSAEQQDSVMGLEEDEEPQVLSAQGGLYAWVTSC